MNRIILPCEREGCNNECNKPLTEYNRNKKLGRRNMCSRSCAIKCTKENTYFKYKNCISCDKNFKPSSGHLKCPKCRSIENKIPCIDCGKKINPNSIRCVKCYRSHNKIKNKNFIGRTVNKSGYVLLTAPDHPRSKSNNGYVFEHILVVEKSLNRFLYKGENIHHKNGVKDDNRIENLELWTKPQPTGCRVEDAINHAIYILKIYKPELLVA